VVFLVDDDLPQRPADMVDRSLGAVLGGLAESDEMAVVLFAQYPRTVSEFDTDQSRLHTVLKRTDLGHHMPGTAGAPMTAPPRLNTAPIEVGVPQSAKVTGGTTKGVDDAVLYAAHLLRDRGRDRRKLIFLITDGRNSRNNAAKFGDVLRTLLTSDIAVYGVGVSEAVLDRSRSSVARYAHATGGDVFYSHSQSSLETNYARVLEEARNQYTLTYSPAGTDRTKDYHSIEVRVDRTGLDLLARDGYYVLVAKEKEKE
jgi:VWFA-related protein